MKREVWRYFDRDNYFLGGVGEGLFLERSELLELQAILFKGHSPGMGLE